MGGEIVVRNRVIHSQGVIEDGWVNYPMPEGWTRAWNDGISLENGIVSVKVSRVIKEKK